MRAQNLICPYCGSSRIWKWCPRPTAGGEVQRFTCRDCERTFTPKSSQDLKKQSPHTKACQICVSAEGAKNLVKVESLKNGLAGATADINGKLVEYLWYMKKEGLAESTVERRIRLLRTLFRRGANLFEPDSVKMTIANQDHWKNTTKEHAVTAYNSFLKMLGKTWNPPKYNRVRKLPFIPQEREIDSLVSGCNWRYSAFLKLLKETGMRSGEAWNLQWIDVDFENRSVSITPEKGSNPRILPLSTELVAMLKALPKKSDKVFDGSLRHFRRGFRKQRKRIAAKLRNPRINSITFHTLRHWKATMEYHKTKDLIHVQGVLGHRSILSTRMYTQLVDFKENDYYVKVAHNVEEAIELVKAKFQYITGEYNDGGKIFRKPK